MTTIFLQIPSTRETRAVLAAAMVETDCNAVLSSFQVLSSLKHTKALKEGAMPVGSVEYVYEAMRLAGVKPPENMSYPDGCQPYLHRDIKQRPAGEVIGRWFVKPLQTKAFTGFVFDTMDDPSTLSDHDREQHAAFSDMPADALVWVAEPVQWLSEWRYYVHGGKIVGEGRYDPTGEDDAPMPDLAVVNACIHDMAVPHNYALDFGVLSTGETAMVEANDAWAIGLYGREMPNHLYFEFLRARWTDLLSTQTR